MMPPSHRAPTLCYLVHDAIDFHGNDEVGVVHWLGKGTPGSALGTPGTTCPNAALCSLCTPASPAAPHRDTPSDPARLCWVLGITLWERSGRAGGGACGKRCGLGQGVSHLEGAVHQGLIQVDDHAELAGVLRLDLGQEVLDSSLEQGDTGQQGRNRVDTGRSDHSPLILDTQGRRRRC